MLPRDTRERLLVMMGKRIELQQRLDDAWEWLGQNVASTEFDARMRDAHLITGNIEVLTERINNIRTGLPEMGTAPDTVTPLTKHPFK